MEANNPNTVLLPGIQGEKRRGDNKRLLICDTRGSTAVTMTERKIRFAVWLYSLH